MKVDRNDLGALVCWLEMVEWIKRLSPKESEVGIPDLQVTLVVDDNFLSLRSLSHLT